MTDEVPSVSGDFAVGAQVAGYVLREQIGWGGMAAVYRAYDVRLDRWVALKILAPEISRDDSFRQRFIRESRAAAAVDHPHIIPVFEAGEADGVLFIAMRYVGGGDVGTLVRRLGPLDTPRATSIVAQVASALDAAHAAGLVHRDVKPANMLLAAAAADSANPDHVYLSDFGLSRQALATTGPLLTGHFVGTLNYMAPEQIEARPVDGRADLYALACAAYAMLAGEPPFRREEDLGLLWAQLAEPPPSLTSVRPDLPPAIDQVLARAMAKSPDDRYQSCLDFAAALLQACGLEWSATGRLLAGSPTVDTEQAAPLVAAGSAATQDRAAELEWSPAPLPASALLPAGVVRMTDGARPAAADTGLAGLGIAAQGPGGMGPDGPDPYPPAPRRRSPVIAAAVFVVILAIAGAAFLALGGGGAAPSRQAGRALPSATANPTAPANSSSISNGTPGSHRRSSGGGNPGSPRRPSSSGSPGSPGKPRNPATAAGPAATVSAYIAAINEHHYARAWQLGGRNSTASYPAFVQGFGTTAKDTLVILSVSGNVVTAQLVAQQTDGTVKTYQGTYTVDDGVITTSDIDQIG